MSDTPAPPIDVGAMLRSKDYLRLLALSGAIGFVVALAAWCFLTVVPWIQNTVFLEIPAALGFDQAPWWWPLPVLAIAGVITAVVIVKVPGGGGRPPAEGLGGGGLTQPRALPGIVLAGLTTLGLGLVLGPSSPVIAIGMGLSLWLFRLVKKDAPNQVQSMIAAAGSFASFSMVFSSPLIAAIILIEAIGLGGATLPLVVLPGLLGAAIGSVVYLGLGYVTGLSTDAYALNPLDLPAMGELTVVEICWTVLVAAVAAVACVLFFQCGRTVERFVAKRPMVIVPVAGLVVAGLAVGYAAITGQPAYTVLFSGSKALAPVVEQGTGLAVGTIALLYLFKGVAWSVSLGSFRGGPVFPAIFMGGVGGVLASNLPGFPLGAAVPAVMAATIAGALRLPLASVLITLLLTASAGAGIAPLAIIGMVVSYLIVTRLSAHRGGPHTTTTPPGDQPSRAGVAPPAEPTG